MCADSLLPCAMRSLPATRRGEHRSIRRQAVQLPGERPALRMEMKKRHGRDNVLAVYFDMIKKTRIHTVFIADSIIDARGIKDVFARARGLKVVGVCHGSASIADAIASKKPDLLMIDAAMPNAVGVVTEVSVRVNVLVIVCGIPSVRQAEQIMKAGAKSAIMKTSPEWKLVAAAKLAATGDIYIDRQYQLAVSKTAGKSKPVLFTQREYEILRLIAEGDTNAQIASKLGVEKQTVELNRGNMRLKLRSASHKA